MKKLRCSKCKIMLETIEFYKNSNTKRGFHYQCKSCRKDSDSKQHKKWRKANIEKVRKDLKTWCQANKDKRRASSKRWADKNKYRRLAHYIVRMAINSGKLIKQPCEKCGEKDAHAHHKDYSKQLDVIWLCRRHHALEHM